MKPRIYRTEYHEDLVSYWICASDTQASFGYGVSPEEAYLDWLRLKEFEEVNDTKC